MSSRSKRIKLAASAVGMLTATVLALSTAPASASNSYNGLAYIQGSGTFTDDWNDEGILDVSHNTNSNATCLWQKILWADGYLTSTQIDGRFGSTTASATKAWQTYYMGAASADGSVGKNTFASAGAWLRDFNNDGNVDTYWGNNYNFSVTRDSNGYHHFYDGSGNARIAGYNYLSCT